jgi:hypothetical protein
LFDLRERLAYFEFGEEDRALLEELRPLLEKHAAEFVASFYRHLLSFPRTRRLLRNPEVKRRLLDDQARYLLSLAGPRIDEAYVAERRRIGEVHERLGLEPGWYLGAYGRYVALLTPVICEHLRSDPARAERMLAALGKLLFFDVQLVLEAFIARREQELDYLSREREEAEEG